MSDVKLKDAVLGGAVAGVGAAVVNNVWHLINGTQVPGVIHAGSITGASLLPLIVAGLGYWAATRFVPRGGLVWAVGTVALTLFSFGGPLSGQLPDGSTPPEGFALLTLPMHVVAGAAALLVIPRFARRGEAAPRALAA